MFRLVITRCARQRSQLAANFARDHVAKGTALATKVDPRLLRVSYSSASSVLLRHHNHPHPAPSAQDATAKAASASASGSSENDDPTGIGHEGLETIDPKDFPELFPESADLDAEIEGEGNSASVLLSDKKREEEEFSWFVDESYPDKLDGSSTDESASNTKEDWNVDRDFVPLWQKNVQRVNEGATSEAAGAESTGVTSLDDIVKLLEQERAKHVKVIDMRDKCDWTDWMVVCEGMSERHLGSVADHIYSALKKSSPKTSPPIMEGRDTSDWVVIDAGTVVIHCMTHEARKERDLEGLWESVKNPLKMKDTENLTWGDVKDKMTKSWNENPGRAKGEDGKRGRRGERDIPLSEVVKW